MNAERECSHKKNFKARCVQCELILARERLASAKDDMKKYGKLVVKLEAEQHMGLTLSE